LSNPRSLYEFIWYYATYGMDKEWQAVCFPFAGVDMQIEKYAEKTGIFKQIYNADINFQHAGLKERVKEFFRMFGYAVRGRQQEYAQRLFSKYVDLSEFETIVTMSDFSVAFGSVLTYGKDAEVIILEDGRSDYAERSFSPFKNEFGCSLWMQALFLCALGYSNPTTFMPLRTTKNCVKFSTYPDKMEYRDYKSIEHLFDMSKTNKILFENLVRKTFLSSMETEIKHSEAVLFTTPMSDFVGSEEEQEFIQRMLNYLRQKYKSISIKRHPRDFANYNMFSEMKIFELGGEIPGEILLSQFVTKGMYFSYPSSILMQVAALDIKPNLFYMEDMMKWNEENNNEFKRKFLERTSFERDIRLMNCTDYNIIDL